MDEQRGAVILFYFKIIQYGLIISAGFGILDAIWLGILPYLNFSYGHPAPSLVFFIFLRGGLFVCWLLILLILGLIFKAGISYNILYLIVALNLTLLLLGLYGFYVEPMQISTEKIEVVVPEISRPIRLVQLSDIHVERTTRRELDLPEVIEALNPDLIVITGDYLNESYTQSPESARDLRNLLSQLHAQLGVYAVNGNVETPSEMEHLLKGLNIKTIKNEVIRVPESGGHFVILGLSYNSLYEDEINLDL
mgnify:CR=1 FL=1